MKSDGSVVYWGNTRGEDQTANIGASTSGLPAQIYVRLASSAQVSTVTGDLVISSLTTADDSGVEIDSIPLSGSFTGSSDTGGTSAGGGGGGGGAPSGGGGSAQVQKSKKGGGKSSAKKSGSGSSKKSAASKSSGSKKSGGKKKKK